MSTANEPFGSADEASAEFDRYFVNATSDINPQQNSAFPVASPNPSTSSDHAWLDWDLKSGRSSADDSRNARAHCEYDNWLNTAPRTSQLLNNPAQEGCYRFSLDPSLDANSLIWEHRSALTVEYDSRAVDDACPHQSNQAARPVGGDVRTRRMPKRNWVLFAVALGVMLPLFGWLCWPKWQRHIERVVAVAGPPQPGSRGVEQLVAPPLSGAKVSPAIDERPGPRNRRSILPPRCRAAFQLGHRKRPLLRGGHPTTCSDLRSRFPPIQLK